MNCGDFESWTEAHAFYDAIRGEGRHYIDRDSDWIVCERLIRKVCSVRNIELAFSYGLKSECQVNVYELTTSRSVYEKSTDCHSCRCFN